MRPSRQLNLTRYEFAEGVAREFSSKLISQDVFDIGAGEGPLRGPLSALGLTWHGFDAQPSSPDIRPWDLNVRCPVPDARPGLVFMLDVIEHLYNPGLAVAHVAEIMTPGALLVLTMPNPRFSKSRIAALLTGYPTCFTQSDLALNHHVFTPWPHVVEHLLTTSGFAIERYVTLDGAYPWPKFSLSPRYPVGLLHSAVNRLIEWYDPSACGMSYGVIGKRL